MIKAIKIEKIITSKDDSSFDKYLTDIQKIPMITAEKEVELSKIIQDDGNTQETIKVKDSYSTIATEIVDHSILLLSRNPNGLRFSEMLTKLKALLPNIKAGNIERVIVDLPSLTDLIYRPSKGFFKTHYIVKSIITEEMKADAISQLVKANLRFVVSVSKKYQNFGTPLSDLINEGNMGLIIAAQRFDHSKGFKFISYAVWWIRQSILTYLSKNNKMVRVPNDKMLFHSKIKKFQEEFENLNHREPSMDEMAEALKSNDFDISEAISVMKGHSALDHQIGDESTLLDVIPDKTAPEVDMNLINESFQIKVGILLNHLPEQQRFVIAAIYGIGQEPKEMEALVDLMGLTRQRIRIIRENAMIKLRSLMENNREMIESI